MEKTLGDRLSIRGMELKNRICAGPMGNATTTGEDGVVSDAMVQHFRAVAKGGAALVIQGAASVTNENKAHVTQTGIWRDEQVDGLRRITEAVHAESCKIILQLEHAGMRALVSEPFAPSPFTLNIRGVEKVCHVMTADEIHSVQKLYVDAARRAVLAGYDGVELHGSHGWMISAFLSPCINRREDEYGQDKLLFLREIFRDMRKNSPDDFVIGIRLGAYNPDLKTGLEQGREIEKMGFDYINVSNNPVIRWLPQEMSVPEGYPFSAHTYSAAEMKKAVSIPVLGGKDIRTTEEANAILAETGVDVILLGRGMLADPAWAGKALSGAEQNICRHCAGRCPWQLGGRGCAAVALAGQSLFLQRLHAGDM